MLYQRYADPTALLSFYVEQGRFSEWLDEIYELKYEEDIYALWLAKVETMSFEEFKNSIEPAEEVQDMTEEELNTALFVGLASPFSRGKE